ncbi:MAG: molybdopterin molybdenumtransferase MoeA, partial [Burkholderiales bacterium]
MNKGLLTVDEALEVLLAGARPVTQIEEVATLEATGRVLARAQRSTMDVPPLDNSAMDGYAVRTEDVKAPDTKLKVAQRIMAGAVGRALEPGTAARIFTGAPIPPGADAIVMQEFCAADGDAVVVKKVPEKDAWIRRRASDIASGAQVLAAGIRLRPQDTGLAASVGI